MFNYENTEWRDGADNLILGQPSGLLDSINRRHPKLFSLYKGQKSDDWGEDDVNLEQSRVDFLKCPPNVYGAMVDNLAYQWELDSVAMNSMVFLLSPFITDSDFKLSVTKNCEIEGLHALTYSEIVRLAVPDPEEVFKKVMESSELHDRGETILAALDELKVAGMEYVLGLRENNQELYNIAFKGLVTFYALERIQFMSSFAHTFDCVEEGWFQGVGKLVQKIMKDEFQYHCRTMQYALKHEMSTRRGSIAYMECREEIEKILSEVVQRELDWNTLMHNRYGGSKKGRFDKWVYKNAQEVYKDLYIEPPFEVQATNPLPFMEQWLNLDYFQNAQQEGDGNNYSLNSYFNDVPEGYIFTRY